MDLSIALLLGTPAINHPYNIAIAGAGVAGLAAALFLKRAGHSVAVYDKAEAPAPVGSGLILQPTGQAALQALGLSDKLVRRGARLKRLDGRLEDGARKVLDVHYDALGPDVYGLALHRAVLFDILHDAAREAGVRFFYGHEVTGVEAAGKAARLTFDAPPASPAAARPYDLVVDALGVRSPFIERTNAFLKFGALWANAPFPSAGGFSEDVLAQRYRGAEVSAGVMPIGAMREGGPPLAAFFWTLRADHVDAWRMTPLQRWKDRVLKLWPEAAPVLEHFTHHDQFVFAHYAHHTAPHPVESPVVHIGDAWHAASPQLGQGANMALLDAWALARALERHQEIIDALETFALLRGRHVKIYQTMSHLFTPVYQSESKLLPAIRDRFAEPLSSFWFMPKLLASMVAGTLGDPLEKLSPD